MGFKAFEIAAVHAFAEEDEAAEAAEPERLCWTCSRSRWAARLGGTRWRTIEPSLWLRAADAPCGWIERGRAGSLVRGGFSWKDDFGRPDTMIDALGAQTSLEVVGPKPRATPSLRNARTPVRQESFLDEEAEFGKKEMAISMVCGLVLGVVLFIVAPAFVTNLIVGEYDGNTLLWNIVDGVLRVAVFVFYIWLIGRMAEIKRMFGYHGAEHKTIHCYEHGLPLTPENARSFPRLHVRCGTAFLIMVMIIAIFVYTVVPLNALIAAWGVPDGAPKLALVILVRILLMPVIAGISYEITVQWAGSHPENPLVKVVLWPGMQMQYLTTNEPDDGQIECAIAAMQRVLEREEAEAAKAAEGPRQPNTGTRLARGGSRLAGRSRRKTLAPPPGCYHCCGTAPDSTPKGEADGHQPSPLRTCGRPSGSPPSSASSSAPTRGRRRPSTASRSRCGAARSTASWARTAPARPPRCACWRRS